MRKKIKVKHTHRYTKEKAILFDGEAQCNEYDTYTEIVYHEEDTTKVCMYVYETYIEIRRFSEAISSLMMKPNEKTKNPIESPYGTFEIEIYTYAFSKDENYIMVEYDIENGMDEKDGFKIEIEVKEEGYEFH